MQISKRPLECHLRGAAYYDSISGCVRKPSLPMHTAMVSETWRSGSLNSHDVPSVSRPSDWLVGILVGQLDGSRPTTPTAIRVDELQKAQVHTSPVFEGYGRR